MIMNNGKYIFNEFKKTSGSYNFDNYTNINPLSDQSKMMEKYVSEHEMVHFLLSNYSSHGMLMSVLRKIIETLKINKPELFIKH